MRAPIWLAVMSALAPLPAAADEGTAIRFQCDRGVELPALLLDDARPPMAVFEIGGRLIALALESRDADGARYAPPEGVAGHIFWTDGDRAAVMITNGSNTEESMPVEGCVKPGAADG